MENQERKKYIMTNQGAIVLGLVWATFMVLYTQLLSPWLSGIPIDYDKEVVLSHISDNKILDKYLFDANIKRVIYVPNKIINFVIQ